MSCKEDKIVIGVGTVTNDVRVHEIPCIKVTALRFIETARARIEKAGGECLTFDELALRAPLGQDTSNQPHTFVVVTLDPPISKGQTLYLHIVIQFETCYVVESTLMMNNDLYTTKYKDKLEPSYKVMCDA
ncbi:putative ribosomal protein L18e [Helianthus debilis subsp. tardiflorus]